MLVRVRRTKKKKCQVGEDIIGPPKAKGPAVSLSDLVKVKTLGTGTFGRVKLVQHKKTKQVCIYVCRVLIQVLIKWMRLRVASLSLVCYLTCCVSLRVLFVAQDK